MTDLVVSTFNCEWRRPASSDAEIIRSRVAGSHIVCFTEASRDFISGEGFTAYFPEPRDERHLDRRKVVLWSAKPWTDVSFGKEDLADYYVAATTQTPIGKVRVHGVVLPYRFSGVQYGTPRRRTWEQHLRLLDMLDSSLERAPTRSMLLGDFNQQVPKKYQPLRIYERLESIALSRFALATGGIIQPIGRKAIDHICHSRDLRLVSAESISNMHGEKRISDHFGLRAIFGL